MLWIVPSILYTISYKLFSVAAPVFFREQFDKFLEAVNLIAYDSPPIAYASFSKY